MELELGTAEELSSERSGQAIVDALSPGPILKSRHPVLGNGMMEGSNERKLEIKSGEELRREGTANAVREGTAENEN